MKIFIILVICCSTRNVDGACKLSKKLLVCKDRLSTVQFEIEEAGKVEKFSLKNPSISFPSGQVNVGQLFPNMTRLSIPKRLCKKFCSDRVIENIRPCTNLSKCKQ